MNRFAKGIAGALLFRLPFWLIAWWWTLPTLCNWDCGIYANISQHYAPADSAFFPLFPLLVHTVSVLCPFLTHGASVVFVSNLFVPVAGVLFLYLSDELWPADGQKIYGFDRRSWLALLLLSIFPEGHFWMRGYSEPVFFALLMAILLGVRHKNWVLAGACCGLIAVTRPQGIWVCAVVGIYLLWRFLAKERRNLGLGVAVLLCGIPFLAFMGWLWAKTGNPIYFYVAQHGWGRGFDFLGALKDQLPRWDVSHLYLYLGVWAGVRFIRRSSVEWKLIGVLSLLLSELPVFFGGFYSYVRFASINPAMFLLVSELISATGWAFGGLTVAIVVWSIVRLAIQVHLAGSTWVG